MMLNNLPRARTGLLDHLAQHAARVDVERLLRRTSDLGLGGVLFVAPLVMGGRHPIGRLVFVAIASMTAVTWCLAQTRAKDPCRWHWSGAEPVCVVAVLLVILQLMSLPPHWLARLSPHVGELLPLWTGAPATESWPAWNRISLTPEATRGGLSMLLAYVLLFLVGTQRLRSLDDVERLLKGIAVAGTGMAVLGLLQYLANNGKFLWFYEHPSRDTHYAVKGTFANQNHLGSFLALSVGPLLWWLRKTTSKVPSASTGFRWGERREQVFNDRIYVSLALGTVVVAGLLTYSRGGILVMLLAAGACTGLYAAVRLVGRRTIGSLIAIAFVVVVTLGIHGRDMLRREFETISAGDLDKLDNHGDRRKIWAAAGKGIPHFLAFGAGIGSHADLYPTYLDEFTPIEYTHAENGYLQVCLESGLPGLTLLVCGIGLSGYWIVGSIVAGKSHPRVLACAGALLAGWLASLVHALVEFNWYLPACMSLTILLLAAAAALHYLARDSGSPGVGFNISRSSWGIASLVTLVLAAIIVQERVAPARAAPYWDEYLSWSLAANRHGTGALGRGRQRSLGEIDGSSPEALREMIRRLERVLELHPGDARANLRMAALCLRQFDVQQQHAPNAMSLAQIRDAALAASFPDQQQLDDWITVAVGRNRVYLDLALRYAKRGLRLGPLEGRGYLYLAEVAFLDRRPLPPSPALMSQALRVRPFDGFVQFTKGREHLMAGDVDTALALWKQAFRSGPDIRRQIMSVLAPQIAVGEFLAIFQPDLEGQRELFHHYRTTGQLEKLRELAPHYAQHLTERGELASGEVAARLWFELQFVYYALDSPEQSADAAQRAVQANPRDYDMHYVLAMRLKQAGRLPEALTELQWCQKRRPDDSAVKRHVDSLRRTIRDAQLLPLRAPIQAEQLRGRWRPEHGESARCTFPPLRGEWRV